MREKGSQVKNLTREAGIHYFDSPMRKALFTSFLFLAAVAWGISPALAGHSHDMDHHGHGAMDHAGMDHAAMGHEGMDHGAVVQVAKAEAEHRHSTDIKDLIPVIPAQGHKGHGKGGDKKSCEHHQVCPSDHVCEMKDHACHTDAGALSFQTCSISTECGGGLPFLPASSPQHHEVILTSYLFKEFNFSSYFLPPLVEVSLAGFPGERERPPQFASL